MTLRPGLLRLAAALSLLAALGAGPAATAAPAALPAAGFIVNNLGDAPDADLNNPLCQTATPGQCSYRAAVQQANATAGPDVISFSVTGVITYSSPMTTITDAVSIVGPGAGLLTLQADGILSPMRILSSNPAASFAVSGLTLTGGIYKGSGGGLDFMSNGATLVISGTTVTNNLSVTGGGVALNGGPAQIINSIISDNQAVAHGGGIEALSPVEIFNTTIQENRQEAFLGAALDRLGVQGGAAYSGGGLYAEDTLTMTNSLVISNSASFDGFGCAACARVAGLEPAAPTTTLGAGLYVYRSPALIQGSRIAGNHFIACITCTVASGEPIAALVGTGAGLFSAGGLITIRDSQIVSNTAQSGGGLVVSSGSLLVERSLVAGNLAVSAGGIWSDSTAVTLTDSLVRDNLAIDGQAGGLAITQGEGLIIGSGVVHNHSLGDGGGLYVSETQVTIVGSLIKDNASGTGLLAGVSVAEPQVLLDIGGGLFNVLSTLTISDTAIVSNTATFGAGIGNGGVLNLRNVTLSGNTARRDGGGIYSFFPAPLAAEASAPAFVVITADLLHTTLAGNIADADNNGTGDGGGLYVVTATTASLHSTLLAANVDRGGQKPECAGTVNSTGYNLVQSTLGCVITATTGDQFNVAAGLLPLQNNGGGTLTHGLAFGSLALNAADPALCLPRDQRGALRPFGPGCDIGAFELAGLYIPIVTK